MPERKYIVEAKISNALLRLSWPVMLALLVHFSYNIVDTIFVARLGAEAVAAVTYCFPVIFIIFSLAQGLAIGATALVAQHIGANNKKAAGNTAEHSLLIAIIVSIIITVPMFVFKRNFFQLMGATPGVLELAVQYASVVFGAFGVVFIAFVGNAVLRGVGDMKTPMKALVVTSILNAVLDPLLIFGIGPFPELGIVGAAIATVASRVVMVAIVFWHLFGHKAKLVLSVKYFRFQPHLFKKIVSVGGPASISNTIEAVGATIVMSLVSMYGPLVVATWGIVFRIEALIFMPLNGMGSAAITMIGQNLGAGKRQRAARTAQMAMGFGVLSVIALGLVLFFIPEPFIRIFIDNPVVLYYGGLYFSILFFSYPFKALLFVGRAILQGSGHIVPVVIGTSVLWAIILGLGFGLRGILGNDLRNLLYVIFLATVVSGLFLTVVVLKGRWLRAVVKTPIKVNETVVE